MTEITMPRLSDSMEEGTILSWLKNDGDEILQGDELVEIETDKATMSYESPGDGVLSIIGEVGATYVVGDLIAQLVDSTRAPTVGEGAAQPAPEPLETAETTPTSHAVLPAAGPESPVAQKATPLARRIAREHGIDLEQIRGSGPNGRILRADVATRAGISDTSTLPHLPGNGAVRVAESAVTDSNELAGGAKGAPEIRVPNRVQEVIARRMSEAKATIPHFQVQTDVDMSAALELRSSLKEQAPEGQAPSLNDLIVKAAALALRAHPRANGSYRNGRFELYPRINVGIAVAAEDSLVVPTITDADTRTLGSIAAESGRLAARVRTGEISPPELSGATFTVSNLGMYGMTAIFPVINAPQAAILGIGATRVVPALRGGQLIERHLMTATLSCDHRILYGADAAQFLSTIRDLLEHPLRMVL